MRDHIHPPRVSAPSCIIPPIENVNVKPYLVPLLPTFHGMENKNTYTHIREFEEVYMTFKEGVTDMELLKLKVFPLTLKDKANIWFNSLKRRTIWDWGDMQASFLKKFFSTHKTNSLKREIYTFTGFDTSMLVNHYYNGMSSAMKQLLETMCGGHFMSKHPEEAMDYLNYMVDVTPRFPVRPDWRIRTESGVRDNILGLFTGFIRHWCV